MKFRNLIHDPQVLLEEGERILEAQNIERKYAFRVRLVTILLRGALTPQELAASSGMSVSCLRGWLKEVDTNGWESLQEKKHTGRRRKLSPEQEEQLEQAIISDPGEFGYDEWSGTNLVDFVEKTFGIQLSIASVLNRKNDALRKHFLKKRSDDPETP